MSSEEVAEASMMRDSIQKSLVKMMLPFLFHCPPHLNADSLEQIHNMKVFRDEFLKSINNGVAVVEEDVVR